MKIEKLNFSVRTYNILKRALINDVEQLKQLSDDELLQIRNLGRHSFEEIKEKLKHLTMTNADHIRSMSDEELVEVIECPYSMQCPVGHGTCGDCVLEWLKQPYKENSEKYNRKLSKYILDVCQVYKEYREGESDGNFS